MNNTNFAPNTKKLTPKQQAMIVERLKDPTAPNSEIIKRSGYNAQSISAQSQQYIQNLKIPEIASRLEPVVDEIEEALITTVRRYKDSDKLPEVIEAMNNARWIHDKVKGKAVSTVISSTTGVTLNIDLTSSLNEE